MNKNTKNPLEEKTENISESRPSRYEALEGGEQ